MDFGALSEENLELKSALTTFEKQNHLLELRLQNTQFSSTIPISVDEEIQTDELEYEILGKKKLSTNGSELTLADTGFESEDGSLDAIELERQSLVPTDPDVVVGCPNEEESRFLGGKKVVEMLKMLKEENVSALWSGKSGEGQFCFFLTFILLSRTENRP